MDAISAGKYDDGISELEKAYEILPHPNVLYNIARAHAEAGNLEKAVENFKKYLETNPPDRDETLAILKGLEAKIREREKAQPEPPRPAPEKPAPDKPSGTPTTPPV
ncbi:MAG: tetratricopeptide repeat protein, partial [Labilithrix sp.]|nr:tetratricopeptide repeat protein [Labilithrix sp.]